ncbi:PREDICTED: uncharacterized protein LOC101305066 [Fragaria vesca subsp. vesca]|uniref:uncharacterized protein LOC101305066 n=1 Tax=Fragaria vesca subsp. vesca TaxID=101020 RepID=UPI0002C377B3|nr:PREDICTED: uncharacterized protein LOC101305066 [Fragaria vesca subsp. vesca]
MATATETSSQQDVKKLTFSFEHLGASSPGSYTPVPLRSEVVPYNEDSKVDRKQTAAYVPMGGEDDFYIDMSQFALSRINEGSKVNCKRTATDIPDVLGSAIRRSVLGPVIRGPVSGEGAYKHKRPCVPCNECSKEHPSFPSCPYVLCDLCHDRHYPIYCPSVPCQVCYQDLHLTPYCPYFHLIPQGAAFDRDNYEVVCCCGNEFNEEKWVCTYCTGRNALLKRKYCSICDSSWKQHSTHECPKDKVLATESKSIRDPLSLSGRT